MNKGSPVSQTRIVLWSLGLGLTTGGLMYIMGYRWLLLGMFFGLLINLISWIALDKTLLMAFGFSNPHLMRAASFVLYHVRFSGIVLIMFLVIPKTNLYFGVGTFLGFLIPKLVLGAILLRNRSEEWWLKRISPEISQGDLDIDSALERGLPEPNPFEIDPVENEIKRYFQSQKGELEC